MQWGSRTRVAAFIAGSWYTYATEAETARTSRTYNLIKEEGLFVNCTTVSRAGSFVTTVRVVIMCTPARTCGATFIIAKGFVSTGNREPTRPHGRFGTSGLWGSVRFEDRRFSTDFADRC